MPVSEPATVANFVYQGCNTDSVSDRSLTGSQYSSDSMTLASCASFCSGYTYFGVEYAREVRTTSHPKPTLTYSS